MGTLREPGNPTGKGGFKKGEVSNPKGRTPGHKHAFNQLTNEQRQEIAKAAGGITPLELFISVCRQEDIPLNVRLAAAKEAAPYMHKKMPISIEGGDPNKPINILDVSQLRNLSTKEIEAMLELVKKAGGAVIGDGENPIE